MDFNVSIYIFITFISVIKERRGRPPFPISQLVSPFCVGRHGVVNMSSTNCGGGEGVRQAA